MSDKMKNYLSILFIISLDFTLFIKRGKAQKASSEILFRIYADNDYLNVRGKGTDKAYTAGTKLDIFTTVKKRPRLIPKFLVGNNDKAIYITQWGITQLLFTPTNIELASFQPQDYFYSGALFLTRSAFRYDRLYQHRWHTEIEIGVRGPAALGKETQVLVHQLIHYQKPNGWSHQLSNAPIVNLNVGFEQRMIERPNKLEIIGGTVCRLGTLESSVSIYPLLRLGVMTNYFEGYIRQFSESRCSNIKKSKFQFYLVLKPEARWVLLNANIEAGILSKQKFLKEEIPYTDGTFELSRDVSPEIRHLMYSLAYGAVIAYNKVAISFLQHHFTEWRKNTYSHEVGNFSFYIRL